MNEFYAEVTPEQREAMRVYSILRENRKLGRSRTHRYLEERRKQPEYGTLLTNLGGTAVVSTANGTRTLPKFGGAVAEGDMVLIIDNTVQTQSGLVP